MSVSVEVKNAQAVANALKAYGAKAETSLERKIEKCAQIVESEAKKNLAGKNDPALKAVDTGYLMSSVTYQLKKGQNPEATVGTNTHYAPYIEYGTRKKGPRPFLRRALEDSKDAISKTLKE